VTHNNIFETAHPFTKEDNRLLSSAFVDFTKNIQKFNFSLGGSATYTSKFGFMWFGGSDISFNASDDLRIYASANTAVRLPTFTDLYLQNSIQKADTNLLPENSINYEVGLKYDKSNLRIHAAFFYRIGNNVIDWVKFPTSAKWESKNLANVNALGADVSAEYTFSNNIIKKLALSYSYLTLDKEAVTFDSKYALDYLRHKAVLTLTHEIVSKLSAQWKLSYNERAGDYTDFVSNQKLSYKPFTMADVRLLWTDRYFDVFADANNLLDVNYADYGGLIQPGINFNVGVRFRL
jgi:iron complex outermembrane receptor protein